MRRPLHPLPGETSHNSGSPKPGEPLFLTVGKILRPHGLLGQALLAIITDFPERLVSGKEVFAGDDHISLVIESVQWHQNKLLVSFQGVQDRDSVENYQNFWYMFGRRTCLRCRKVNITTTNFLV